MLNAKFLVLLAGAGALALMAATPARADLVADGITYSLTETATANPLVDQFTLGITGINGPSDTEGGRSGVVAFAFNPPANLVSGTLPGFTFMTGGLNSMGCDGTGNFFCFSNNSPPGTSPALPANSSLSFTFDLQISSGTFAGYNPDFKIDWIGSQSNPPHSGYDLVSETLTPNTTTTTTITTTVGVPEPGTLALLGSALTGLGLLRRRRRKSV